MRKMLFAGLLGLLGSGCGSESTPAAAATETGADVTSDAPADTMATDAADGGACDLGAVPGGTVAPYTASSFVIVKDDAGVTVPTPTGGDTKGDFRVAKLTVYLAPAADGQVDTVKSTASGVGWFSFTDKDFRSSTDSKITLETSIVGTVKRAVTTIGKGSYVLEGSQIKLTPVCGSTTADTPIREFGWSRLDADHAYVFLPATGASAGLTLATILELERIK